MKYYSTRDTSLRYESADAIKMGLSRDGGLLTPVEIPQIDRAFLESLDIVMIVSESKDVLDVEITVDDLVPENFNSVDQILALVEARKS